jgi:hypothetical protein
LTAIVCEARARVEPVAPGIAKQIEGKHSKEHTSAEKTTM